MQRLRFECLRVPCNININIKLSEFYFNPAHASALHCQLQIKALNSPARNFKLKTFIVGLYKTIITVTLHRTM